MTAGGEGHRVNAERVNAEGCVADRLSLAQQGLRSLPEDLPTCLTSLDASGNNIAACADALAGITGLRTLDLADNALSGSLGGALRQLQSLTHLSLERNHLTALRGELAECTALARLNIGRNRLGSLDGLLPTACASTLVELLAPNALSGGRRRELPPELWTLTALRSLDLRFNALRSVPPALGSLSCLEVLRLGGNRFRELPVEAMCSGLANLQLLDLCPWHGLSDGQRAAERLETSIPGLEVLLGNTAASQGSGGEAGAPRDVPPEVLSPGQHPSLRAQLAPLSTPTLQHRLVSLFGVRLPPGSGREHHQKVLDALCNCFAESGHDLRAQRTLQGVPVPDHLTHPLLEELSRTVWPRPRERGKVAADEYLTLARPRQEPSTRPGSAPRRQGGGRPKPARYSRLWELGHLLIRHLDLAFADEYTSMALTKNFAGSPHIDTHDISFQWTISLGDFHGGGELCVETSPETVCVIDTKHKAAKVDGRYVHWVRGYNRGGGDRYSVVFYKTQGAARPKSGAVLMELTGGCTS